MPSNYEQISEDNIREYGEGTDHLKVFASLYSNRTHFIYEILQNAEDAGATRIEFRVTDHLEIRHDGRPFTEADVRGVCGIGKGTGRDDLTRIGKFGIGFKSVYAYTSTVEVHSGNEHFTIERFVRPRACHPIDVGSDTLFVIPLDKPQLTREDALKEIVDGLHRLPTYTLLFLRGIRTISVRVDGVLRMEHTRAATGSGNPRTVEVTAFGSRAHWLVFERPIDHEVASAPLRVEVAYLLGGERGYGHIIPLKSSPLVVFFPTEKETELAVLIQGPYRTTPARDNIPFDHDWNQFLIQETAQLIVSSLEWLRDEGRLDIGVLSALPLDPDDFPEDGPIRPVFDAVRSALMNQPLLPAAGGGYVRAAHARIARSAPLRRLFSDAQLADVLQTPGIRWLPDDVTPDRAPTLYQYLRNELGIPELRPGDIVKRLDAPFLTSQPDDWIVQLYRFLDSQPRWQIAEDVKTRLPLIRLENGNHTPAFDEHDKPLAYLPPPGATRFPTVKRAVANDEPARAFLESIGLQIPDNVAEVLEYVLPDYTGETIIPTDDKYLGDLTQICRALNTDSSSRRTTLLKELRRCPFLRAVNAGSGELALKCPTEVYLRTEELDVYFEHNPDIWFLDELLPDSVVEDLCNHDLLNKSVKVTQRTPSGTGNVVLEDRWGHHARGLDGFDPHTEIDGLTFALAAAHTGRAKVLWNHILLPNMIRGTVERSTRQDFNPSQKEEQLSTAGTQLVAIEWLPDRNGRLHKPSDLSLDDLPDGFKRSEELARALGMRPTELATVAAQYGLDPDKLQLLLEHPELINKLLRTLEGAPDGEVDNCQATRTHKRGTLTGEMNRDPGIGQGSPEPTGTQTFDSRSFGPHPSGSQPPEGRFVTYVHHGPTRGYGSPADPEVEAAAIKYAVEVETNEGRHARKMPPNNVGYDIESFDPMSEGTRLIEVKGLRGSWGTRGVTLTSTEFQTAQNQGARYWLYVVEAATTEPRLYRIQDPVNSIRWYAFDDGWKDLAHP